MIYFLVIIVCFFFKFKVRKLLEQMDKVLYFRSSSDPLILDEEQRETRRKGLFVYFSFKKTLNRSIFDL